MTLEELTAQRDALLTARYRGVRTVEMAARRVTYATDTESLREACGRIQAFCAGLT